MIREKYNNTPLCTSEADTIIRLTVEQLTTKPCIMGIDTDTIRSKEQFITIFFSADTSLPYKTYTGYTVTSRILFYLIATLKNTEPYANFAKRTKVKEGTLRVYLYKLINAGIITTSMIKNRTIIKLTPAGKQVRDEIGKIITLSVNNSLNHRQTP